MEEIVLKNYETFDEIPNGLLQVKENSNLMYVRIGKNSFIAREFIDSIEFEDEYIKYIVSYFNVTNNTLCAGVTYNAKSETFTHAKLTLSFKKKYMLFFWKTVEIGYIDEEWMGYCYDLDGYFYQEFPATGSGTYKANFYFEVYGTSGVTDVIEDSIQCEY